MVKHANATTVTVTLRVEAESLHIAVIDDGDGLLSPGDASGLGLYSMRERATELGGTCVVSASPHGRGTEVRVELPAAVSMGNRA